MVYRRLRARRLFVYGFQKEISKAEFKERIENNTLLEVLNKVPVHKGDVFFISAGTLHAIGKGILIAEIQQNSNTRSACREKRNFLRITRPFIRC